MPWHHQPTAAACVPPGRYTHLPYIPRRECNVIFWLDFQIDLPLPSTAICAGEQTHAARAPLNQHHSPPAPFAAPLLRSHLLRGTTSECHSVSKHAGYGADHEDSCAGDSGGPLLKATPRGYVLVGIVSYGPYPDEYPCGAQETIGAYTSIAVMRPWLDRQIKALRL